MICKDHPILSITKQCKLLGLNRSSYYYEAVPESELNLKIMRLMDEHYLIHPYKGVPQMHLWIKHDIGIEVNIKRISRLYYDIMGLQSIQPGPHTSKRNKKHKTYPYLLRDLEIEHVNQLWEIDITYIPMAKGFLYLIAFIDLYSRYALNWSVSNTMDQDWVCDFLEETITVHGSPEIINTDQGSQFTSELFTKAVTSKGIRLSMDGKGRATDNAFIERLWRSVKYEKIYVNPPKDGADLYEMLREYFRYYNNDEGTRVWDQKGPKITSKHPLNILVEIQVFNIPTFLIMNSMKLSIRVQSKVLKY